MDTNTRMKILVVLFVTVSAAMCYMHAQNRRLKTDLDSIKGTHAQMTARYDTVSAENTALSGKLKEIHTKQEHEAANAADAAEAAVGEEIYEE